MPRFFFLIFKRGLKAKLIISAFYFEKFLMRKTWKNRTQLQFFLLRTTNIWVSYWCNCSTSSLEVSLQSFSTKIILIVATRIAMHGAAWAILTIFGVIFQINWRSKSKINMFILLEVVKIGSKLEYWRIYWGV